MSIADSSIFASTSRIDRSIARDDTMLNLRLKRMRASADRSLADAIVVGSDDHYEATNEATGRFPHWRRTPDYEWTPIRRGNAGVKMFDHSTASALIVVSEAVNKALFEAQRASRQALFQRDSREADVAFRHDQ